MTPERLLIILLAALVIVLSRWMGKLQGRSDVLTKQIILLRVLLEPTDDEQLTEEVADLYQGYGLAS